MAPTPMAAHFDLLRGNFSCSDASSGSMAATSKDALALVTPVVVTSAPRSSASSSCTSGSPALSSFSGYPGDGSNTSASTSPALSCLPSPLCVSSAKGIPNPLIISVTCDPSETHRPRSSVEQIVPDNCDAEALCQKEGVVGSSPEVFGQDDASGEFTRCSSSHQVRHTITLLTE